MNDAQIALFCEAIDKRFVYKLLSRNWLDFGFVVASGLIKPEGRLAVWNALFSSAEHQARILQVLPAIKRCRIFCAQVLRRPGSNGFGAGKADGVTGAPFDASGATGGDVLTAIHTPTIHSGHRGEHF